MNLVLTMVFQSDDLQRLEEVKEKYLKTFKELEGQVDPIEELLCSKIDAVITDQPHGLNLADEM